MSEDTLVVGAIVLSSLTILINLFILASGRR